MQTKYKKTLKNNNKDEDKDRNKKNGKWNEITEQQNRMESRGGSGLGFQGKKKKMQMVKF